MKEPYRVIPLDHTDFTRKLNEARITGPLAIVPERDGQSHGFRSSSVGSCLRQVGYRLLEYEPTDDRYNPDYTLKADMGTAIHARVQAQAVGAGMIAKYPGWKNRDGTDDLIEMALLDCAPPEVRPCLDRWDMNGHIDGVMLTRQGTLAILDIKTADPKCFKKGYRFLDSKLQGYAAQITSYMWAFRGPAGERADTGYLYFINRGEPNERMLFKIPWQAERWAIDMDRIEEAWQATKRGELPPADPERGVCRFCAHTGHCPGKQAA